MRSKPALDFSSIPGHQVHETAPEPKVPVSGQLDSENIKAFRYNAATRVLTLKFHDRNREYLYAPVPPSLVRGLIDAESANTYFTEHIKHLLDRETTQEKD